MPHVIESVELVQVLAEAEDIARSVNQKLTTAHQLLALFTIPNRAELLLRDRGIDEDKVLDALSGKPDEPDGTEREIRERARPVVRVEQPPPAVDVMLDLFVGVPEHAFPAMGEIDFAGQDVPVPDAVVASIDDQGQAFAMFLDVLFGEAARGIVPE